MTVTYFAYGSNMCSAWLRSRVPSAASNGRAVLHNYELRFRKRSSDGSSKCDVVPAPGRMVHGVVFQIPSDEKPALDVAEGLGKGYREMRCTVAEPGGELIAVFMYVAEAYAVDELCSRTNGTNVSFFPELANTTCRRRTSRRLTKSRKSLRGAGLLV